MTEDEAKTKWCPFTRASAQDTAIGKLGPSPSPPSNRLVETSTGRVGPSAGTMCIASACMAWRWLDKREMRWTGLNNPPEGEGWEQVENTNGPGYWLRYGQTPSGRCGLASE